MKVDLNDKTAIITGGSRGYGTGIAKVLAEKGCRVWITARGEEDLRETAERIGVHYVPADVTNPDDWDRVFEKVTGETGRLDILVNNAGAGVEIAPLAEQTDEQIQKSIDINLTGAIFGCRRAARVMARQGSGTIVNVSSVCEQQAWPGFGPYSAAKAGLAQLSNCLYTELRERGVRVTTLTPSWGATNFAEAAGLEAKDEETREKCIQPRELGEIVAQICELPAHLEIQNLTLWPRIQEVVPL
jgi:NAD(P)-dependent dehydrogenase (short-subunit alcohol dehydrogenase family)